MKIKNAFSGFLIIIVAAFAGLALVLLPSWLMSQYQAAQAAGQIWGTIYLVVIGTGLALLAGSSLWLFWKLWGRSITKRIRRERRNRNPSQLTRDQKSSEIDENIEHIEKLKRSATDSELQRQLDPLIREVDFKREQQTLEIVAFGTISSGKSSVLNLLAGRDVCCSRWCCCPAG